MEVLQDGVLAFLAATGLAALFWLLTGCGGGSPPG